MDKKALRQVIVDKLRDELELLTRAALMARDEATHEESRPTSKFDTHGQEAAYLAESQARLAAEMRDSIVAYQTLPLAPYSPAQPVDLGSLISLENRGRVSWYFVGPSNGGLDVSVDGQVVTIVTLQSPLGRQLQGARIGDAMQLPGRSTPVPWRVTAIC